MKNPFTGERMSSAQLATEYLDALRTSDQVKCWILRRAVETAEERQAIAQAGDTHLMEVVHAPYFQG